jgi:hypothetical protein
VLKGPRKSKKWVNLIIGRAQTESLAGRQNAR